MLCAPAVAAPRVLVLTDIGADPDDAQSMVRLLLHANELEIEGLLATTSQHNPRRPRADQIRRRVWGYGVVRENLARHAEGWPQTDALMERVKTCSPKVGKAGVGPDEDTEGSDWIVSVVDADDPRPVWVLVWGGPNCLAQALQRVSRERTPEELAAFVAKLRVYTISDQDDSARWIRQRFPELFLIVSPGHTQDAYARATWAGISGDELRDIEGGDFRLVSNPWLEVHVRSKGPLGKLYPRTRYLMEGDSPTFLYLLPNGLGVPEEPSFGSWGGRYERDRREGFFTDTADTVVGADGREHTSPHATIFRWREAYQNELAARMDWSIAEAFEDANHPPALEAGLTLDVRGGAAVQLDAGDVSDSDGDALALEWFVYPEPGSLAGPVALEGARDPVVRLQIPRVERPETLHVILAVRDAGAPPLTRYRRFILRIAP